MSTETGIRSALGLSDDDAHWYDTWERLGPPPEPVVLPSREAVAELLTGRLGVDPVDVEAAIEAYPDPQADPVLWWLLERTHHQLVADMGGIGMLMWPRLHRKFGLKGRFVHLYAFLATLPALLAYHRSRGVPEEVTWATLSNLAEKLRLNRVRHGEPGLDVALWFTLHFRGSLYRLGRLEFALERLSDTHAFTGEPAGLIKLGVHIPGDGGPMGDAACGESIARARAFFAEKFADLLPQPALFTCASWLLDPQLREFLAPTSNIVRFQDRFTLIPPTAKADSAGREDVLLFVFNRTEPVDPDTLPRDTTLTRHLADGLSAGRNWQVRLGWFR